MISPYSTYIPFVCVSCSHFSFTCLFLNSISHTIAFALFLNFPLSCACSFHEIHLLNCVSCAHFVKLCPRAGCYYVFGSWAWKTGWTWNSQAHLLEVLNLKEAFSLTLALNASTDRFSECEITSKATYYSNGEWELLNASPDASKVVFFKLRKMWHISWVSFRLRSSEDESRMGL